jgi:hypothetical protein
MGAHTALHAESALYDRRLLQFLLPDVFSYATVRDKFPTAQIKQAQE